MKPVLMLLASLVLLVLVFLSGVIITANVIAVPEPHKFANIDKPDLWTSEPKQVDIAGQQLQRLPNAAPVETASAAPVNTGADAGTSRVAVDNTVTAGINPASANAPVMPQPPVVPPAAGIGMENGVGPLPANAQSHSPVDTAQAEWCHTRYRSYRFEDNSYQPYDGSPRRQCQAPGMRQDTAFNSASQTVASASAARPQINGSPRADMQPLPPESIPDSDKNQQVYDEQLYEAAPQAVDIAQPAGSHEDWCSGRYRSYRVGDNSYQPFEGGPRRQCQSPFG